MFLSSPLLTGEASSSSAESGDENAEQQRWTLMYKRLVAYKQKFGDCCVPPQYSDDRELALWVSVQRARRRKCRLTVKQLKMLHSIGFVWDATFISVPATNTLQRQQQQQLEHLEDKDDQGQRDDPHWIGMYNRLRAYKKLHGDCDVAPSHDEKLHDWVETQRTMLAAGRLRSDRKVRLVSMGFNLVKRQSTPKRGIPKQSEETWDEVLGRLQKLKVQFEQEFVPTNSSSSLSSSTTGMNEARHDTGTKLVDNTTSKRQQQQRPSKASPPPSPPRPVSPRHPDVQAVLPTGSIPVNATAPAPVKTIRGARYRLHFGTITRQRHNNNKNNAAPTYQFVYDDDGTTESLTEEQMNAARGLNDSHVHKTSFLQRRVAKCFDDGQPRFGTVMSFSDGDTEGRYVLDSDSTSWKVRYDNGVEEEYNQQKLEQQLRFHDDLKAFCAGRYNRL